LYNNIVLSRNKVLSVLMVADAKKAKEWIGLKALGSAMTCVVSDTCFKCKLWIASKRAPSTASMKARTWLLFTRTNASIAACAHPREVIKSASNPGMDKWLAPNAEYAGKWPNIIAKKTPPIDAAEWEGMANKFELYFSRIQEHEIRGLGRFGMSKWH
jgi:ferredoxin